MADSSIQGYFEEKNLVLFYKQLETDLENIPKEERYTLAIERCTEYFDKVLPKSLIEIFAGSFFDGDSGNSLDMKPNWLNYDKFLKGQKVAQDYYFPVTYSHTLAMLPVFSFQDGLRPLIASNGSSTPYTSFNRYLVTISCLKNWQTCDPWKPGTPAYNDMRFVRKIHRVMKNKMNQMPAEEFAKNSTICEPWCPTVEILRQDFRAVCQAPIPGQNPLVILDKDSSLNKKKMNQFEMSITQMSFVCLFILYPEYFGASSIKDDDLEAFCHLWRAIGYLLGVEDQFNTCRGTLQDIKVRSKDYLDYWVKPNFRHVSSDWEHYVRCMMRGISFYLPGITYEDTVLDISNLLDLPVPKFYRTLSYTAIVRRNLFRFSVNYLTKITGIISLFNYFIIQLQKKAKQFDKNKINRIQHESRRELEKVMKNRATGNI